MTTTSATQTEARVLEILDAYLADLRAGRAPDREALLAQHPDLAESLAASFRALDFVQGAGRALEAPEAPAGRGEPPEAGRVLGDYRILRELGRGGMAVVYEAEQVSLGRHVALKVLPFAAVLDAKQLQRFKNEAQAAAQLQHPHIVPVHAVGCERGVHYYAMQYVEGQSLAVAIRELRERADSDGPSRARAEEGPKTPLSLHGSNRTSGYVRMAAQLGIQAAQALDHAHHVGIVHRDVKPANLLIDRTGTLWITDFGLAHSMKDVGLTMTGELLGTIRYMSPEQALAKRVPIDHRTDVYSLGATLYELLTLEPAFPGDDPHAVLRDIASKEPVPPRRLNPALPRDLETVLMKAMAKDAGARYATAQEMADDLSRFLENRPVEAKRLGPLRRTVKWGRRHRVLVGAAAVVLLLAVVGLATGTALLWHEQEQTQTAFGRAESNLALALDALDQIYVDEVEVNPRIRAGLPRDLLDRGLGFYEEFARKNARSQGVAVLLARAQYRVGLIYRELNQEGRSKEALGRAISTYREVVRLEPGNAWVHNNLGSALKASGDVDGAIQEFREAIRLESDELHAHVNAHVNLGNTLKEEKGDLEGAIKEFREAIRLEPDTAMAHYYLANVLHDTGTLKEAIQEYREAIRLEPSSWAHNNLGFALRDQGDPEGAIEEFRKAILLEADKFDAHYNAHLNLGGALQKKGDLEGAIPQFREAVRLKADPGAHNALAGALLAKGDADGAIQEYRESVRLAPDLPEAYTGLGLALMRKRKFGDAIDAYRAVVRLKPDAAAHYNLGTALAPSGDLEGAIQAYREAIRLLPDLAVAHTNLGNVLRVNGDVAGAIEEYREAIRVQPTLPEAHMNLGTALRDQRDLEGAIRAFREGTRLAPDSAVAHLNLAIALDDNDDPEGAIQEFREALRLHPDYAEAHTGLGSVFLVRGETDAAIHEYLKAIWIRPDYAEAHCNLGHVYLARGRYRDALPWLRKGHEAGSSRPGWRYPSRGWVESAERMVEAERRLDRVLAGEARPTDALERTAFAEVLYAKSRHAESARMYAEAFTEDSALAEDLSKGHRYNAACSASVAAARGGADAAEWRGRALDWLRAHLAALAKVPSGIEVTLQHWKQDPDLAAVRDRLDEIPESERGAWRDLWTAVDRALGSARPAPR